MVGGILGWIVLTAAALAALGVIWRMAIRPVVKGIERLVELVGPDEHGKTMAQRMRVVEERTRQLGPNGGHSLYDHVGDLRDRVENLEKGQRSTNKRITAVTTRLAPMAEAIGALAGPPRRTASRTRATDQK